MARDTMTALAANGAIAVASGMTNITKATEGAHTLANPAASATSLSLDILSTSSEMQTVTGSFNGGGNTIYTVLQFTKGGHVNLISDANAWYIGGHNRGVTFR